MLRHIVLLCHWLQNCKPGHGRRLHCAFASPNPSAVVANSCTHRRHRRDKTVSSRRRSVLGFSNTNKKLQQQYQHSVTKSTVIPAAICIERILQQPVLSIRVFEDNNKIMKFSGEDWLMLLWILTSIVYFIYTMIYIFFVLCCFGITINDDNDDDDNYVAVTLYLWSTTRNLALQKIISGHHHLNQHSLYTLQ